MSQGAQDFTPAEILAAGQDAEARGHHDYAEQFYRHLTDYYPAHPEAAQALAAIGRLRQRETRRDDTARPAPERARPDPEHARFDRAPVGRAGTGRVAGEGHGRDINDPRPAPTAAGHHNSPDAAHVAMSTRQREQSLEQDHVSLGAAMAAGIGADADGASHTAAGAPGAGAGANTTRPSTQPPARSQSHPAPPHANGRQDGTARPAEARRGAPRSPGLPSDGSRPDGARSVGLRPHEPRVRLAPAEPVRRGLQRAPALPRVRKRFLLGRIAALALSGLGVCLLLIGCGNLAVSLLVPEISGTLSRAAGGAAVGLSPLAFATLGLLMALVVGGFLITAGQLMSAGFATANATAELVALQKAVMRRQLDLVDDEDDEAA